jgi:hypothetical protein
VASDCIAFALERPMPQISTPIVALARAFYFRRQQRRLKDKLHTRWIYWFEMPDTPSEVKALAAIATNKLLMRQYVRSIGLRLPNLYAAVSDVTEIDFTELPDRIVLKPHSSWNSGGVMLIDKDRDLLSGIPVPRSELPELCRRKIATADLVDAPAQIMVEEFVSDYDPRFSVPRDFKVYVAGGRAWVIRVIDRNGPKASRTHSFYSRDWARIRDPFQTNYLPGPTIPKPPLLHDLILAAERMAVDLGAFLRLDFYLTADGPVFGEITWNPSGGTGFTEYSARYLSDLMDRFPDQIRRSLSLSDFMPANTL